MGFCKAYKIKGKERKYGFDQKTLYENDNAECVAYVCEDDEILIDVDNPRAVEYFDGVLDYYGISDTMKHRSKSGGMHYLFKMGNLKPPFKSKTRACLFIGSFIDGTEAHTGVDIKCGKTALSHIKADDIDFYEPFKGKLYDIPWVLLPATFNEADYKFHDFTEQYDGEHTKRFLYMNRYFAKENKKYYDELIDVLSYLYSPRDRAKRQYTEPDKKYFVGHWLFGDDIRIGLEEKMERYAIHDNGMLYDTEESRFIYPSYGKTSFERVFGRANRDLWFELKELEPETITAYSDEMERDYIVDGIITKGSLNMIYGYAGKGKTYSSLYLAEKFVNGRNLLNHKCEQTDVTFVAWESAHVTKKRLRDIGIDDKVTLMVSENRMHTEYFDKFFDGMDGQVVILDNFGEFAPVDNQTENKFVLISYLSELAKYVHQHNITLFIIAHSPKNQTTTKKPSLANLGGWAEMASRLDSAIEVVDVDECVFTKNRDNITCDNIMFKPFSISLGKYIEESEEMNIENLRPVLDNFYNGISLKGITPEDREKLTAMGYKVFKVAREYVAVDRTYRPLLSFADFHKKNLNTMSNEERLNFYYLIYENNLVKEIDFRLMGNGLIVLPDNYY